MAAGGKDGRGSLSSCKSVQKGSSAAVQVELVMVSPPQVQVYEMLAQLMTQPVDEKVRSVSC